MMRLTEDQQAAVRQWAKEGASLGDIQKWLDEQFNINITYMEARFLISDLNVSLTDKEEDQPKPAADALKGVDELDDEDEEFGLGAGDVSVSIDQIAKPSTMISGKVTFSDGETAEWYVDAFGQLALNPNKRGYRPTQEDFVAFQQELQEAARRAGY